MIKKYNKLIIKKLVMEKSKVKILKLNNDNIWNCSNGAKIIFGKRARTFKLLFSYTPIIKINLIGFEPMTKHLSGAHSTTLSYKF